MICQNMCILQGRLGSKPEQASVGEATVHKMSLAIDSPRRDKDGNWESNTSWAECEYWENSQSAMGDKIRKLEKGQVVVVHSQVRAVKKEKDGVNRTFVSFRINNLFSDFGQPNSDTKPEFD